MIDADNVPEVELDEVVARFVLEKKLGYASTKHPDFLFSTFTKRSQRLGGRLSMIIRGRQKKREIQNRIKTHECCKL